MAIAQFLIIISFPSFAPLFIIIIIIIIIIITAGESQ